MAGHYGATPTDACNAILAELAQFQYADGGAGGGGTGFVKTIKRLADPSEVGPQMRAGAPAMLVVSHGGPFVPMSTSKQQYLQQMKISIVCIANYFETQTRRMVSDTPTVNPGVEDLQDLAVYYGCRALWGVDGLMNITPIKQDWVEFSSTLYVGEVEIQCQRSFDLHSEEPAAIIARLGIVHNPSDPDDLWTDPSHTIPNTDEPPATDGGVADL